MLGGWLLALTVAASPGQCGPGGCGPMMGGGMEFSPGMASGSFVAGQGGFSNPYDSVSAGGGGGGDQLYPFDSPEPWLHGYFQELPAHGGYGSFRPHNYKHVLAQMEVAGRWGMSPVMAYSHQWYHKYRQRSGMHPNFGMGGSASLEQPSFGHVAQYGAAPASQNQQYDATPRTAQREEMSRLQQAAAYQRGYTDTAIPGISAPFYQRAVSERAPAPAESVSADYLARMDQLQKQLEEQTFQMQLMHQRMQSQDKSQLQARQQPNHVQFQNGPSAQEPRQLQQFAATPAPTPAQGYQELPAPGALAQPGYGQPAQAGLASQGALTHQSLPPQNYAQPAPNQPGYPQPQPLYQATPQYQTPSPYQVAPSQGYSPSYGAQPGYPQPTPTQSNGPLMNPIMTVPPQGPIMQVPPGQAYFSSPQNSAPAYAMQPQQPPIPGTHAVWQQNAGQAVGPGYTGQHGAATTGQQLVPQQQQFQQLQYAQPGANSQPGYPQMPAAPGQYYQY